MSTRNRAFTIAQHPAVAENVTALSQNYYDAIMLNGVVVDMLSARCYRPNSAMADADGNVPIGCTPNDPWLVDPLGSESKFGADANNAHIHNQMALIIIMVIQKQCLMIILA